MRKQSSQKIETMIQFLVPVLGTKSVPVLGTKSGSCFRNRLRNQGDRWLLLAQDGATPVPESGTKSVPKTGHTNLKIFRFSVSFFWDSGGPGGEIRGAR